MIKKIPKSKFIRALISLVFAYLLWAVAITGSDPTTTNKFSSININYAGLSENLIVENKIETLDIKLYGRMDQLNKIKKNDIIATVDLSQVKEAGTYTFEVIVTGIPDTVSVTDMSTKYITLTISEVASIEKSFSIDIKGNLPSGYYVLDHATETDTVNVYGPQNILSDVETVRGEINLSSNKYDFESVVTLYAYDEDGNIINGVNISPNQIEVSTLIGTTKTVDVHITTTGTCLSGYEFVGASTDTSSVEISGPVSLINNITSISTNPVDINGASSSFTASTGFDLPQGVTTSRSAINVFIEMKSGISTKEITYTSLQVRNTPVNLTCDLSSFTSLSISVSGEKSIIDSLASSDITVYIDLSGLSAGSHNVDINYIVPDGVTILSSSMDKVNVRLTE